MHRCPFTITAEARRAIETVIAVSGRQRTLRVAFLYGCGGAGYRISLEIGPAEGDLLFELGPLKLAIEPIAASDLDGAILDCIEGDEGPELVIDHPAAIGAPMCGW